MSDVFSSLNTDLGLIIILIVAAFVMIARAVLAPPAGEPYRGA